LEEAARRQMLERLADQDDSLLEQLIADVVPPPGVLYEQLARALREDRLVPVFIGSAEQGLGLLRLLKGLRHEVPGVEETRTRLGISASGGPLVQPFKTWHLPHVGKQSLARIWRGTVADGSTLGGGRVSGVLQPHGARQTPVTTAHQGEVAVLGRLDAARTGDCVEMDTVHRLTGWPEPPPPVHQMAITAEKRTDDVKLPGALARLVEEDPSLSVDQDLDTQQLLLGGQGELHLREALERLGTHLRVPVVVQSVPIPYRETVRPR
jgi:elongation factor G